MEDPTAARGARTQGAGGVHSASSGNPRGGGPAGGRLKPEVKVAIGGDRQTLLGWVVMLLPSKIWANFLLRTRRTSSKCISQTKMEGERVFARRRELVDSATQMMVADELYDGKPCVDLSEEELMQGLKTFAGVDMQQTSDEDFCRQIFRVLNDGCERARR